MAEQMLTKEELEASKGATGRIVRIVGPVVDAEFPGSRPAIYNALTVDAKTLAGDLHLVLEVETHLPGNLVRSVAMSSTDGLVRARGRRHGQPDHDARGSRDPAASGTSWASPSTRSRCPR